MSSKNLDLKKYSLIQLLVTIVILAVACVLQFCPTRKTEFLEGDLSISHTCGNSVSVIMIILYYAISALSLMVLIYLLIDRSRLLTVLTHFILTCSRVLSVDLALVNILKVFTGRPRPCFFDLCGYPSTDHIYGTFGHVGNVAKCSHSYYAVNDAFRSFPSGHSMLSSSVFALYYLFLNVLTSGNKRWNQRILSIVAMSLKVLFFILSILLSASRIFDYRHFASDVVCGFLLGIVSTFFSEKSLGWSDDLSYEEADLSEKEGLISNTDV